MAGSAATMSFGAGGGGSPVLGEHTEEADEPDFLFLDARTEISRRHPPGHSSRPPAFGRQRSS